MNIPVKFHALVVAVSPGGPLPILAEIQVLTDLGTVVTVWSDTFSDPLTATQVALRKLGEMQQ